MNACFFSSLQFFFFVFFFVFCTVAVVVVVVFLRLCDTWMEYMSFWYGICSSLFLFVVVCSSYISVPIPLLLSFVKVHKYIRICIYYNLLLCGILDSFGIRLSSAIRDFVLFDSVI